MNLLSSQKHGTTTKPVKTVRLTDEPEEIPKSEMDIKMEQEAAAAAAAGGAGTTEIYYLTKSTILSISTRLTM